jgi:phosphoribosylaminoimidazole-succinocarboxamide synthase
MEISELDIGMLSRVAYGKTKTFYEYPGREDKLLCRQKDILTVKNGLVKMPVPEIGIYKALQNDAIQHFLRKHKIPTSYNKLIGDNLALNDRANMIGVEFVERNASAPNGSWALRNPGKEFPKGQIVSEMFDKRSVVKGDDTITMIMDEASAAQNYPDSFFADPYIREDFDPNLEERKEFLESAETPSYWWNLYDQKKPLTQENRLAVVKAPYPREDIEAAKKLSRLSFIFLTKGLRLAGQKLGLDVNLIDDKTEYGYVNGKVVLSDDLTADAFRMDIIKDGVKQDSSKQTFRDLESRGATEEEICDIMPQVYARTTEITEALRGITL